MEVLVHLLFSKLLSTSEHRECSGRVLLSKYIKRCRGGGNSGLILSVFRLVGFEWLTRMGVAAEEKVRVEEAARSLLQMLPPHEVLVEIFSCLPGTQLTLLALMCHKLRH